MKKIAIFADVQNIYYTSRQAYGKQFNYRKLWKKISQQGEIVCAYAYAIDRGDNQQQKFQEVLKHIGFEVKLKPYIQRSDGSAKGDWDVGLTIDVMETAAEVDTVILLTGDGDFAILLNKVKQRFLVTTEAYGVPKLTAKALIDACTVFNPIDSDLLLP
ncbi:NYN domain-containing protein [Psychromonas sp. RZ22]|uniref:NYN domain-containing protein n=1 Tax=Psychromonas algarum TaxID=2555643 RepID=UPI001067F95E|nr:NYN domain-containing protein [Psychromonas sp. RZ22]TEW56632.1 NYN domain-containing protein [Psychromonas sp. RZ22]